jgi:CubicO group peptidase (beta-lactamase class C family)
MNKLLKFSGLGITVLILATAILYFSDPVFWFRYFNVRPLESYQNNPFPTKDRMFPQEVVEGTSSPIVVPVASKEDRSIPAELLARAEETAKKYDSTSFIYIHNGVIQSEHYWPDSVKNGPVYAFSMSKTVAALLTGIAIDQNLIKSVDDPVGDYIEEWKDDERGQKITIRHLLTMSSGIEPTPYFSTNPFWKGQKRQIGTNLTKAALSYDVIEEPGSRWEYNGTNTYLLGLIIERTSKMRYTEYLSRYLWHPVGNATANMWMDREGGVPRTFVGIYAAPMDWVRLGLMMLNHGKVGETQLVSPNWIHSMIEPATTAAYYGFQTWLAVPNQEDNPPGSYYLFNGFGGQTVFTDPSKQIIIVRTGPLARNSDEFLNALPGLLPE